MCTRLDDFAWACVCMRSTCVNVCVRVRRGLDVTPAVGMNRVSGRALQQAAAACSHCKLDSVSAPKPPGLHETLTQYIMSPTTTSYHYSYYLQVLQFPLSQGHDPNRSEGNVKLTWGKHQKWTSISILALSERRKKFPDSCWQTKILGICLVWPVYALLLCGSLPCVWLSRSENIPCGITEEEGKRQIVRYKNIRLYFSFKCLHNAFDLNLKFRKSIITNTL